MPGQILTTASQVKCMHGGTAILATSNFKSLIDATPALLESDIHAVVGCPFTVGNSYSPCIRIQWSGGASLLTSGGIKVLTQSSVGKCLNAGGATQGIAIIATTQLRVSAI